MRVMGGLKNKLPITYWTFLIGTLAIAGVFPLAGFFSKDEILWFAFASDRGSSVAYVMVVAAAFCTAFYMFRILWMTFWGEHRGVPEGHGHGHGDDAHDAPEGDDHAHGEDDHGHGAHGHAEPQESPWQVTVPLVVLATLSAVGGFLGVSPLLGDIVGFPNLLHAWYHPVFEHSEVAVREALHHNHGIEWGLMGFSVLVAGAAIGATFVLYRGKDALYDLFEAKVPALHRVLWNKWYVDELYEAGIIKPLVLGSKHFLHRIVDEVVIDGVVNGVGGAMKQLADKLGRLQNGDVGQYATVMVSGMFLILLVLAGYGLW